MTKKYLVTFQFNVKTHDEIFELWLPLPLKSHYQHWELLSNENDASSSMVSKDPVFGADYLYAKWAGHKDSASLKLDMHVSINKRIGGDQQIASPEEQMLYLQPRPHVPTDGIVAEFAQKLVEGLDSPFKKARAIYHWVCDHSQRDPNQIGCGVGNVKDALADEHICGRCADVSTVFVALMRAAGIPTREVFGIRLKSLGIISESMHCRCEFYIEGAGWVPCDPADVSKACLDENLSLDSARYREVREKFFGIWEPNCLALNSGRDFTLPPGTGSIENYLMYPIGISLEERKNPYAPNDFAFEFKSEEI